jgi:hypothetical protein
MISHLLPEGMPVSKSWLMKEAGLDRHAVDNLLKSGQLASLAPGVYQRPGTRLSWMGIVAALQTVFRTDLVLGGLSALEVHGFSHYLPLSSQRQVRLYGRDALPGWLDAAVPDLHLTRHPPLPGVGGTGMLTYEYDSWARALVNSDVPGQKQQNWPFVLSSPERAFLEVLMDVPGSVSFEHAAQLPQGMTSLSPRRLETLLGKCTSVKVRRLFYWLADRQNHAWFRKLPALDDLDKLGSGSGNRMLATNGKLDAKYRITVPEEMWSPPTPTTARSGS